MGDKVRLQIAILFAGSFFLITACSAVVTEPNKILTDKSGPPAESEKAMFAPPTEMEVQGAQKATEATNKTAQESIDDIAGDAFDLKPDPSDYSILEDASDYMDAVVDGAKKRKTLFFSTCSCELVDTKIVTDIALLKCKSKVGYHDIYIAGDREKRKRLVAAKYSKDGLFIVKGKIVDVMLSEYTDRRTGKRVIDKKSPVVLVGEVIASGQSCY